MRRHPWRPGRLSRPAWLALVAVVGACGMERIPPPAAPAEPSPPAGGVESPEPDREPAPAGEATEPDERVTSRPTARGDLFEDARRQLERAGSVAVPPGNYRVELERIWLDESESWAIGGLFEYTDENVSVVVADPIEAPTVRVGLAVGNLRAGLEGALRRARSAVREQVFLLTVPGSPARLAVGRTRVFRPIRIGHAEGAVLLPEGEFLGTSIEVRVDEMEGGSRMVSLRPVFTSERGSDVAVDALETRVVAPVGTPIVIASRDYEEGRVMTTLLTRRSESRLERGVLILTVSGG